jgi:hypothetical protein
MNKSSNGPRNALRFLYSGTRRIRFHLHSLTDRASEDYGKWNERPSRGCLSGIVANLWTPSMFLSKRQIVNILGSISIPGQPIGINIPGVNSQLGASAIPSPAATATPTRGETAEPEASPTP